MHLSTNTDLKVRHPSPDPSVGTDDLDRLERWHIRCRFQAFLQGLACAFRHRTHADLSRPGFLIEYPQVHSPNQIDHFSGRQTWKDLHNSNRSKWRFASQVLLRDRVDDGFVTEQLQHLRGPDIVLRPQIYIDKSALVTEPIQHIPRRLFHCPGGNRQRSKQAEQKCGSDKFHFKHSRSTDYCDYYFSIATSSGSGIISSSSSSASRNSSSSLSSPPSSPDRFIILIRNIPTAPSTPTIRATHQ